MQRIIPGMLFAAALFLTGCPFTRPGSANTPREMFEAVVLSPVPSGITQIEGTGDTMGGYNLYLRFRADTDAREKILSRYRFKKIDCGKMDFPATLPSSYDRFVGGWNPGIIKNPACHEAVETSNKWSKGGHHKLLMDPLENTVYFTGVGI